MNAPAAPSARPGTTASRTADPSRGQNSSRSAPATKRTVTSLPLPPAGPQWYGSLMGTGIAATLTQTLGGDLPGARGLAVALLVVGWCVFVGLTAAFAARIARRPAVLAQTIRDLPVLATWGMVSMGILALGSATATVVPAHWPSLASPAWVVDGVLWSVGTVLGILTALGFAVRLIGRDVGAPTTTWGLPIVPPMVSATTGAALVPHLATRPAQLLLVIVAVACFFLALVLGMVVFAVAYHHHWRVAPLPLTASTSAWIPLGVVGQSTAAAQALAVQAQHFVLPEDAGTLTWLANLYGTVMLTLGVPLIAWATVMTLRGFRNGMPFSPGWWALTFPVGTVCLGLHGMAGGTGIRAFGIASDVVCLMLLFNWALCGVATVRAVRAHTVGTSRAPVAARG
ncbi:putative TDT family transporter [Kocuria rhizophila DC2201]|uniref:Putative TDT family transporter n=1 Tax=Kocuria rhizophila (strain ATCC 9341 / DSM 348 / NBRC 103217 / DC2201) TaxID=378753 RepID=B2GGJ2_KOCRD|nr:putative TDT family transporter [Kocuria rhizophila DC2201]